MMGSWPSIQARAGEYGGACVGGRVLGSDPWAPSEHTPCLWDAYAAEIMLCKSYMVAGALFDPSSLERSRHPAPDPKPAPISSILHSSCPSGCDRLADVISRGKGPWIVFPGPPH
jgi:hypothetical protein